MLSFPEMMRVVAETHPPQMRYQGDDSPESFADWQRQFRAKLNELRGEPQARPPARVEVLGVTALKDHTREHVVIDSVLGTKIPAYVLAPKGKRGKRPGVLALHGHVRGGKEPTAGAGPTLPKYVPCDYGLASVRAGFVTLCPDWWGWGERSDRGFTLRRRDPCDTKFVALQKYGISLLSVMISDGLAALDALMSRPDVDARRVGVIGNSLGGRMSMWLAALDPRLRCAVCAGCFNCFRERSLKLISCGAQWLPGLLQWGDVEEIFSLIAPRSLMIMSGNQDTGTLDREHAERMTPVIERAYRVTKAQEKLTFYEFDGGHYMDQKPAMQWLKQQLGAGDRTP